jgi:nickel transport protein
MLYAPWAAAHEVLHEVVYGKAIALKAFFADGEPLAYTEYQIFSPVDPKIPHQKGRTDRDGYLAFVPSVPGSWQVKVTEPTGHGLDITILSSPPTQKAVPGMASWAFTLRPVLGIALILVLFSSLYFFYRRKGKNL